MQKNLIKKLLSNIVSYDTLFAGNEVHKLKKIAIILVLILMLCSLSVHAENIDTDYYDYYIENYNVEVIANPDRSYDVTETIDVYFNIESHGIYRDIPTYGAYEDYEITNVEVPGDYYEYDGYGSIRIGEEDITLDGKKQYIIKYSLEHYADTSAEYDYFFMDIIGTEWDVPILDFSGKIILPEDSQTDKLTLTGGYYGNDDAAGLATVSQKENIVYIEALSPLDAYNGITLEAQLNEGAFYEAEIWLPEMVVNQADIEATIDEYGYCTVKENYKATVNEDSVFFSINPDDSFGEDKALEDIRIVHPNGKTETESNYGYTSIFLDGYEGETVEFSFEYSFRYDISALKSPKLFLTLCDYNTDIYIENLQANINLPADAKSYHIDTYFDDDFFTVTETDSGISVSATDKYTDYTSATLEMEFEKGVFRRHFSYLDIMFPLICLVFLGFVAAAAFLTRDKDIVKPIEFYPPEDLNPADIGFIIDNIADAKDITGLIVYWASQGHLSIEESKRGFTLHKLSPLDDKHTAYEKTMFNALWRSSRTNTVTDKQLQEKFYIHINKAIKAVKKKFTKEKPIEHKPFKILSYLFGCLFPFGLMATGAPLTGSTDSLIEYIAMAVFFAFSCAIVSVAAHSIYNRRYKKITFGNIMFMLACSIPAIIALIVFLSNVGGRQIDLLSAFIGCVIIYIISFVSPWLRKQTDYGNIILGKVLGFKEFIKTAEKQKLEMLINEDPEYFYHILPYAQVLGVTNTWINKFDDLLNEPPNWYSGTSTDITTATAISGIMRVSRKANSAMISIPASSGSSSGGGFSGGGGGGYSGGGGFSGGGSGGGGGGRW